MAPGAQEDGTWRIPAGRLAELRARTEVLNRRVTRTGGAGLSLELVRTESERVEDPDGGVPRTLSWAVVRVTGEVPAVDGWAFLARVEHHAGVGNIVSTAPGRHGEPLPQDLRTADPTCDHCGTRRMRKDTFVLRDGSGSLRRVGRNCLQDFLRGTDPEAALRLWSLLAAVTGMLSSCSEEGYGAAGGAVATTDFLACTASAIRRAGWVSRKEARASFPPKEATADHALWICGRAPQGAEARREWLASQPSEDDYEEAGEAVAWASALGEREDLNEYLFNVRVAVSLGAVEPRHAGLVASAVMARRRELEAEAKRARAAAAPGSHFGTPGKRGPLPDMAVVLTRALDGAYGMTTMVVMEAADGSSFKWFASGVRDYRPGDVLRGKGTVKAHEEWEGRPVTVVTRCVLDVVQKDGTECKAVEA